MSLRGFHIVFISLATLLCVFLAVWAFFLAPEEVGGAAKILGAIGAVGGVLLPVYGVYFYRKASKLVL